MSARDRAVKATASAEAMTEPTAAAGGKHQRRSQLFFGRKGDCRDGEEHLHQVGVL